MHHCVILNSIIVGLLVCHMSVFSCGYRSARYPLSIICCLSSFSSYAYARLFLFHPSPPHISDSVFLPFRMLFMFSTHILPLFHLEISAFRFSLLPSPYVSHL